jgi:hypothetical protein
MIRGRERIVGSDPQCAGPHQPCPTRRGLCLDSAMFLRSHHHARLRVSFDVAEASPASRVLSPVRRVRVASVSRHWSVGVALMSLDRRVPVALVPRTCRVPVASVSRHCRVGVASLARSCRVGVAWRARSRRKPGAFGEITAQGLHFLHLSGRDAGEPGRYPPDHA